MPTNSRLSVLRVAKERLKLTEDDYRSILENVGGSCSARDLSDVGFDAVMERFRELGFTSTARANAYGERNGMATPGQITAIRKLWKAWATDPSEAHLNTFLENTAKVSSLRFLDSRGSRTVMTALRAMVAKKAAAHGG